MSRPLRVLHVSSEVAPYSKTGGLADVSAALPRALDRLGIAVEIVTPRHRSVDPDRFGLARRLRTLSVSLGGEAVEVGVLEGTLPASRARIYFVDHPPSFDRPQLYGEKGVDYPDNARRFALLGKAALALSAELGGGFDVLHGHDWQAGPALLYASELAARPKMVFTVHNLAYQGIFPESIIDELSLPRAHHHPEGMEYWKQVSLLKAGLTLADKITTVSPRYAREIQTEELGMGLDGVLRARAARLVGILNGVDYEVWNPERDPHLQAHYSAGELTGKRVCKAALQRELGLPVRPHTPLCGSISRLTEQKGFDLIAAVLPSLFERDMQYVVLGAGEPKIERALVELAERFPGRLAVKIAYDDPLAHRIEAGCDLFVMPSRFEPCGLNQLYSLRYGTPPIVHATGGLDDSIVDYEPRSRTGTGFKFGAFSPEALQAAWTRALLAYQSGDAFVALVRRAMAQNFSWATSARSYAELYAHLRSS